MKMRKEFAYRSILDYRDVSILIFLAVLPNILAMINIPVKYGFKLHVFQFGIFLAAFMYGPLGGLVAGIFGSAYSGIMMSNPYLIVGNGILGIVFGYMLSRGMSWPKAVAIAFLCQLPWLVLTDYFLVNMPLNVIAILVVSLAVSDVVWAYLAKTVHPFLIEA